ncbi:MULTISPECIES: hypothetical protein [Pelotomaculum]|nr:MULTISPECIES: hypothetical protein [Pelotomaculum]
MRLSTGAEHAGSSLVRMMPGRYLKLFLKASCMTGLNSTIL